MKSAQQIVEERIDESELTDIGYFHPVRDGSKRSAVSHSNPDNLSTSAPSGNYGICASGNDTLVLIDIDDYKDADEDALQYARDELPATLTFESAHDGEGRLYHVPTDDDDRLPADRLADEFGKANITAATWGEIRVENQYIVGPGSQLDADGCTKNWCDNCATPDGGQYTILNDSAIATLDPGTLVDVISADPNIDSDDSDVSDQNDSSDADKSIIEYEGDKPDALNDADTPGADYDDTASGDSTASAATGQDGTDADVSPYDAIERLDAQRVAGETIVQSWTDTDHTSGDNVEAFTPTWAGSNCNGTANVVGEGGWRDTGGRGRGGPIVMAAIDCDDIDIHEDAQPPDVTGQDWVDAYQHLRNIGFASELPELSTAALQDIDDIDDDPGAVAMALDALLRMFESDDGGDLDPDSYHWQPIWKAVGQLAADNLDDYAERVADVCDVTTETVESHSRHYTHREHNGPVIVDDGKTWYLDGNPLQRHELLNFELDVESTLEVKRGPVRAQLQMQLQTGEAYTKSIQPKIFNKKERFDDEILSESFGTQFSIPDTGVYVQDLLDGLRMWIHHQDAPHRVGVSHLGIHNDELVIPDRTLAADGWTDTPDHVYLEREIGAERRVTLPDQDDPDTDAAAEIVETLPHTRDPERLLPVLGWFYAAPLRPTVESFSESGEFNHLSVTGDTGSGKTATLGYLWRCFGMSGEPFSVDSSSFAQLATFSSTNSIPLWFDEYKPSDISDYKIDRFHDLYRKATRGTFAERGNADKTTTSYKIQAPVCVSGEQAIQGPAERRRSVMTQFRTETTDAGTETAERFKQLIGQARMDDGKIEVGSDAANPADHALAYYRFICDADDAQLKERWYSALERAHKKLDEMGVTDELDDLEIQGVQTVIFGHDIMQWFAESIGANVDAIPDEDALHQAIEYMIGRIGPAGSRKSHVDRFIELFGRAAATDEYLERGTHYEIVSEGQESEEIRINLPRSFDAISKYARDHGIDGVDLLNDASDYRDRFRELASTPGTYVVRTKQYTPGVSDCTGIRTTAVMDAVEFDRDVLETDFELSDFDDTASDEHDDHDDASDGDSTDQPDYLSAGEISTAGLKSLEEIPSVRGTAAGIWEEYGNPRTELVGENGSIDIHFKGYDTPDVPLSPGGEYEIDGLRYNQDQDGHEYCELRNSPAVDIERLDDADDEDESEESADELLDGPIPINRLADVGTSTGYETVTVEVVSWESPETDAIAHSGIVKDATGIVDVVAFDELSELSNYPEGRHYRFENVQIDEYDGDLQLILDPEITDWTEIQPGVGNLDHVSDESSQDLQSATDGGTAADTSNADGDTDTDTNSDTDETDTDTSDATESPDSPETPQQQPQSSSDDTDTGEATANGGIEAGDDDADADGDSDTTETDSETTEMLRPDGLDKPDPNAPESQKRRIFKIKAKLRAAGTGDRNDFLTAEDLADELGWDRDMIDATIERLRRESNAMFGTPDEGWQMSK